MSDLFSANGMVDWIHNGKGLIFMFFDGNDSISHAALKQDALQHRNSHCKQIYRKDKHHGPLCGV